MKIEDIKRIAREVALRTAPTEYGFFDAKKRLQIFHETTLTYNLITFLGSIELLTDSQIEKELIRHELDE